MGWLSGWKYRKQITIAGTADGVQTNYQMKLVINRSAGADSGNNVYVGVRCESDYDDIRITNSDGATLRDYWVESSDASSATIWIEFNSIAVSPSNTNFYLYYGNLAASAVSNGVNTWILFDHFDVDLSKWTVVGGVSIAGSICTVKRLAGVDAMMTSTSAFPTNRRMRARLKSAHFNNASYSEFLFWWYQEQQTRIYYSGGWGGAVSVYGQYNGAGPTLSAILGWAADTYAIQEEIRNGLTNCKYNVNDANLVTISANTPNNNFTHNIGLSCDTADNSELNIDWIVVGVYTVNEPTWSTWGGEENFILGGMSMSGCGR